MSVNKKIAHNVIYIYAGVIICTLVSLVTVPVLLKNLGTSDYGIYNLVAGIITMLSFFKGSMIIAIQRFMNVALGENNKSKVNRIYTVGVLLFFAVGIIVSCIIEVLGPFISNGYLNIVPERVDAATTLFQVLVISTFVTTIGVPYDALFNVREDMWLFSFFNSIDAILRLLLALSITYISMDKLIFYAYGLVVITVLIYIIKYFVCKKKYPDVKMVKLFRSDLSILKDILSFIGWNLYSALAKIFSTQGFAVVLNLFMGTTINASYGIANQINGAISSFTSSVEKAFTPQIMKSEGMKDNTRMINLSLLATKYSVLTYSFIAIPFLASLDYILKIWLSVPPTYTKEFTEIIIIASIISMLSLGLAPMLYAKGKIRGYLSVLGTFLILTVFAAYGVLQIGMSVIYAVLLFVVIEVVMFFVRLYYCKKIADMQIRDYLTIVLIPFIKSAIPSCCIPFLIEGNSLLNVTVICVLTSVIYVACTYCFGLTENEKTAVLSYVKNLKP